MALPLRPRFDLTTHRWSELTSTDVSDWLRLARSARRPLAGPLLVGAWIEALAVPDVRWIALRDRDRLLACVTLIGTAERRFGWRRSCWRLASPLDMPGCDPLLIDRGANGPALNTDVIIDAIAHAIFRVVGTDRFEGVGLPVWCDALRREATRRGLRGAASPAAGARALNLEGGFAARLARCSLARQRAVANWQAARDRGAWSDRELRRSDQATDAAAVWLALPHDRNAGLDRDAYRRFITASFSANAAPGGYSLVTIEAEGLTRAAAWFLIDGETAWRGESFGAAAPDASDWSGPLMTAAASRLAARGVRAIQLCDRPLPSDAGWGLEVAEAAAFTLGSRLDLAWDAARRMVEPKSR